MYSYKCNCCNKEVKYMNYIKSTVGNFCSDCYGKILEEWSDNIDESMEYYRNKYNKYGNYWNEKRTV